MLTSRCQVMQIRFGFVYAMKEGSIRFGSLSLFVLGQMEGGCDVFGALASSLALVFIPRVWNGIVGNIEVFGNLEA
ncbi:hypothetical protein Tco_1245673 [Tanacetum coccineum]